MNITNEQITLASQYLNTSATTQTSTVATATETQSTSEVSAVSSTSSVDVFELTKTFDITAQSGVYTSSENMSSEAIDLDKLAFERAQNFQNMITQMAGGQANAFTAATYVDFSVSAQQSADALESISEGGQWSSENVANNILDMAKALSGGDPEKFELLKNAVEKGFEAAAKSWGEDMPEITNKTYDLVMQGFDTWEAELFGTDQEV